MVSRFRRGGLVFAWLLFAFWLGSTAAQAAPVHELTSFSYATTTDKFDAPIARIEIGLSRPPAQFKLSRDKLRPKKLIIDLADTRIGELSPDITLDGKFARFLTIREPQKRQTQIVVNLAQTLDEQNVDVYLAEAERKKRKPYRLVIDIGQPVIRRGARFAAIKGKCVVIDPGHGGSDRGASGPSQLREKDVTLAVALYLREILQKSGVRVAMTRTSDVDVFGPNATARQELDARVNVGRDLLGLDVFLSIHCDAFGDPRANGTGTFYFPKTFDDVRLAQCLQNAMVRHGGRRDRGIKEANFYVVKHSAVPAALVELAFISNYEEEGLLADEKFQREMAKGLAEGLAEFFHDAPEREKPLAQSTVNLDRRARSERLGRKMAALPKKREARG